MTKLTIVHRHEKKEWSIPEAEWNGLTLDQLLTAYGIIFSDSPRILGPQEVLPNKRMALLLMLTGLGESFLHEWQADCRQAEGNIEDGDLVFLAELDEALLATELFFRKVEDGKGKSQNAFEVNYGLTRCPWPRLDGVPSHLKGSKRKLSWYAPAFDEETGDGLSNISLYELANVFTLFERMVTEKDARQKELLVQRLLAVLYRPAKPKSTENLESGYGGDIRQPLIGHEAMVKVRQAHWKNIPREAKQLLVFWFASCRRYIIEKYPLVFRPPNGEKAQGNDFGWGGVLLELAGGLPHLQEVYAQPYQNGLIYLSRLEDQRVRREMEEKKRRLKNIR